LGTSARLLRRILSCGFHIRNRVERSVSGLFGSLGSCLGICGRVFHGFAHVIGNRIGNAGHGFVSRHFDGIGHRVFGGIVRATARGKGEGAGNGGDKGEFLHPSFLFVVDQQAACLSRPP
jgi:hypothetical protein